MTVATMMEPTARTARQGDSGDHESLRLWLRLFTCTTMIERQVGSALKREFGSSLPRFDLLAQLDRCPDGLRMSDLSERTLTTGGNITWLVRALESEGLVSRRVAAADRRAAIVRLTPAGQRHFNAMARAHERWIVDLFALLPAAERRTMRRTLDTLARQFRSTRASE